MGISDFTEQTELSKSSISLALSGADQTFISTVLNENITNDLVDIYRGFLDSSNNLISEPFLFYKGQVEGFSIQENDTASTVNLNIVSHWADFEKKNGRKTNNTSQQRFFSTDVGMDFSSENVLDIKWGRE
jgi:PAB1-binding protein PBP1